MNEGWTNTSKVDENQLAWRQFRLNSNNNNENADILLIFCRQRDFGVISSCLRDSAQPAHARQSPNLTSSMLNMEQECGTST